VAGTPDESRWLIEVRPGMGLYHSAGWGDIAESESLEGCSENEEGSQRSALEEDPTTEVVNGCMG
jgi:hypothetical protein